MLGTLDAVGQPRIDADDPERVILFGSQATGGAETDSDFDRPIVQETARHPLDRRIEVARLLSDRRIPLDILAYTPQALRDLFATRSPFIEDVIEAGRVSYMRKATAGWLADARKGRLGNDRPVHPDIPPRRSRPGKPVPRGGPRGETARSC